MSRRRRPLHTCGVSVSEIASKAHKKAQDINGPIGTMTKKMTKLATPAFPFVHALQSQWLAVLSFADDHILVIENIIESLFPPSVRLFSKLDEFVHAAETLPALFDDAVDKFPTIIHRIPFLDWASTCLVSWLKFLISTLTQWGSGYTKEKEIRVDLNCNNCLEEPESTEEVVICNLESTSHIQSEHAENSCISASSHDDDIECESETKTVKSDVTKSSYKEMLEKGKGDLKCSYKEMLEKGKKEEDGFKEDSSKAISSEKEVEEVGEKGDGNGSSESIGKEDHILQLFDSSWLMKGGKGGKGGSPMHHGI